MKPLLLAFFILPVTYVLQTLLWLLALRCLGISDCGARPVAMAAAVLTTAFALGALAVWAEERGGW